MIDDGCCEERAHHFAGADGDRDLAGLGEAGAERCREIIARADGDRKARHQSGERGALVGEAAGNLVGARNARQLGSPHAEGR